MNVVNVWMVYQGITKTAEIQVYFYNYLDEDMKDNIYDRLIIRHAEGRRRTIYESDDDYVDDKNTLFEWINGAPRC